MKKNTMMRLASVLLIVTLLTTSVISGTFAKYTTSDSGSDTARVAKWGFEATDSSINLTDLFINVYDVDKVTGYADVVAPGTTNSVDFTFAYDTTSNGITRPEVAYNFKVLAEVSTHSSFAALDSNPNFIWTLKSPITGATTAYQTVTELVAALNALDGTDGVNGKDYAPKTLPAAFYGASPDGTETWTLGWRWFFGNEGATGLKYADDADVVVNVSNDPADTNMGNADALNSIVITITVAATQID